MVAKPLGLESFRVEDKVRIADRSHRYWASMGVAHPIPDNVYLCIGVLKAFWARLKTQSPGQLKLSPFIIPSQQNRENPQSNCYLVENNHSGWVGSQKPQKFPERQDTWNPVIFNHPSPTPTPMQLVLNLELSPIVPKKEPSGEALGCENQGPQFQRELNISERKKIINLKVHFKWGFQVSLGSTVI